MFGEACVSSVGAAMVGEYYCYRGPCVGKHSRLVHIATCRAICKWTDDNKQVPI